MRTKGNQVRLGVNHVANHVASTSRASVKIVKIKETGCNTMQHEIDERQSLTT